jgi:hypothetical protein
MTKPAVVPMLLPHPVADLFPTLGADEYAALRQDIRQNGVRVPILAYKGKILDGRRCRTGSATSWRGITG